MKDSAIPLVRVIDGLAGPFHAVHMDGYVYIAEYSACVIKKIHPNGRYEWLGGGPAGRVLDRWQPDTLKPTGCPAGIRLPHTIKRNGNYLEVALLGDNALLVVDKNGIKLRKLFSQIQGEGLASFAHMPDGGMLVTDYRNNVIQHRTGDVIKYVGCGLGEGWRNKVLFGEFSNSCGFVRPHDLLIYNDFIFVADTGNHRIKRYRLNGDFAGWIGQSATGVLQSHWSGSGAAMKSDAYGGFSQPVSMSMDTHDNLYVLEYGGTRVQVFDKEGAFVRAHTFAGRLKNPYGISIDGDMLLIANTGGNEVLIYRLE